MAQELQMTLSKSSGDWRIQRVQTIRTLSP